MTDAILATPAPKIPTLTMTRGAAYLLEGILQDSRPCDTPDKTVKWGKLYGVIRKSNDRTVTLADVAYDIEKARNKIILAAGDQTDPATKRALEETLVRLDDVVEEWRNVIIEVAMTRKNQDTAKQAVEYRIKNQDHAKGLVFPTNESSYSLLEALGFTDEE